MRKMIQKTTFSWLAPAALLALGGLAVLPGCDVVDDPNPKQLTFSVTPRDRFSLDSAATAAPLEPTVQKVLIEDMTGQYCGNCPRAAVIADSMRRTYPGRVFATEVHVTDYFAKPRPPHFPIDFRVPGVSEELDRVFDLSNRGLPQGAVNRAPFAQANGDRVATFSLWPGLVAAELAKAPSVDLRVTPIFNSSTRLLSLRVSTKYLESMSGRDMRLGIMLVEDGLVGAQKDYRLPRATNPEQTVEDYEHHDVMRVALLGTFGTPQVTGPSAGQQFNQYLSYQMPAASVWNDRKMAVIAYIADGTTRQIVQVTEVKIP